MSPAANHILSMKVDNNWARPTCSCGWSDRLPSVKQGWAAARKHFEDAITRERAGQGVFG